MVLHRPTRSINTVSSETLEMTSFVSASSETGLWCRSLIGALETPYDVTHVLAPTNRTGQEWQRSNHDAVAHNSMGKSCWSLCHPYWHYTHDLGLRGVWNTALGHYSLEQSEITPWFTPPSHRPSTPVKPKDRHVATGIVTTLRIVAATSIEPRMTRHVTTASKDMGHSSNSGTSPTTGQEWRPQMFFPRKNII
jgi:hypothetical protein